MPKVEYFKEEDNLYINGNRHYTFKGKLYLGDI